ncbi:type VI secretion protein [Sphingomonas hankyongi]|uniref:Type VI secretion protein n=1 Tax=Sphingomonas hankyongi TaxID=2908209 RepID=A0ABT0S3D7_9SPHN|nr:type VI secretion protein [Sphingomonas hankyongi]MCL6730055.1 type VI secretion protein [Sphingomonas hankyongi]
MITTFVLAAAAAAAAPANPATADLSKSGLVIAVEACRQVADNAARLACFDRAVGELATARAKGDVAVVDRKQVQEVRRSLFGFGGLKLPFFGGKDQDRGEAEQKELNSTLAAFRPISNGYIRFDLTEPQSTWESIEPTSVFEPKKGTKVHISRGAFGSYWAEIANQPAVKVRRIH